MKLVIDFDKLTYRKPKGSLAVILDILINPMWEVIGATPDIPPFEYRYTGFKQLFYQLFKPISYKELGQTICFDDEQANQILLQHRPRLDVYNFLSAILYFSFLIVAAPVMLFSYFFILAQLTFNMQGLIFYILSNAMIFIVTISICILALKISIVLINRHFADTLALISGIYLLIFLEKESTLANPESRRDILHRIQTLRRNIVLLSAMFSNKNDTWPTAHFRKMEQFVSERERWAIAPQEQTLADLRQDFSAFLEILVTGEYGKFEWDDSEDLTLATPEAEQKPAERIARFLASILPFVLLLILFIFPAQIKAIGFDNNIVGLFLLAWLLLAIDSSLKLGMVERASAFAKTIKDLG